MSVFSFTIPYQPPYQWERMLDFFVLRAIPGVEAVRDDTYMRTVRAYDESGQLCTGWLTVQNSAEANELMVTCSASLQAAQPYVRERVARLFDTQRDPAAIGSILTSMEKLHPGSYIPGTRIPGCYDGYEMAVRAVLGQQVSVKSASTLAGRMAEHFGTPLQTGIEGLDYLFPAPADIEALAKNAPIENSLGPLGIIRTRSRTILALAQLIQTDPAALEPCVPDGPTPEEKIAALIALPGIGDWTAQYLAMRSMNWSDAFPAGDLGVKKFLGLDKPKEIVAAAEIWRPMRAYAVLNMWSFEQTAAKKAKKM